MSLEWDSIVFSDEKKFNSEWTVFDAFAKRTHSPNDSHVVTLSGMVSFAAKETTPNAFIQARMIMENLWRYVS